MVGMHLGDAPVGHLVGSLDCSERWRSSWRKTDQGLPACRDPLSGHLQAHAWPADLMSERPGELPALKKSLRHVGHRYAPLAACPGIWRTRSDGSEMKPRSWEYSRKLARSTGVERIDTSHCRRGSVITRYLGTPSKSKAQAAPTPRSHLDELLAEVGLWTKLCRE